MPRFNRFTHNEIDTQLFCLIAASSQVSGVIEWSHRLCLTERIFIVLLFAIFNILRFFIIVIEIIIVNSVTRARARVCVVIRFYESSFNKIVVSIKSKIRVLFRRFLFAVGGLFSIVAGTFCRSKWIKIMWRKSRYSTDVHTKTVIISNQRTVNCFVFHRRLMKDLTFG